MRRRQVEIITTQIDNQVTGWGFWVKPAWCNWEAEIKIDNHLLGYEFAGTEEEALEKAKRRVQNSYLPDATPSNHYTYSL